LQAVHQDEPDELTEPGVERLRLETNAGTIHGRLHPSEADGDAAVLWVFGAGGGLGGPAGGLYPRLAEQLRPQGVSSLRLDYRRAGYLEESVLDTLMGIAYLQTRGKTRVVLVGHSFGGAVVITAGAVSDEVVAVAALSSQTYGAGAVGRLSPRPVLFIHGEADEVLPDTCSRSLYAKADEPKELILYPGCRHGLDQCREELDRNLLAWLRRVLAIEGAFEGAQQPE
jgi:hypothetical protein